MRAAVHDRYGPPEVLRIEEVTDPAPGPGELLVRVRRSTVNRTDTGFRAASPVIVRAFSGLWRPRRRITRAASSLGRGRGLGEGVTRFAVGDRVFGVDQARFGANAELMVTREDAPVATMPDDMPFDEGGRDVRRLRPRPHACLGGARLGRGQHVLVYGATGSIGTAAVQLAHAWGARVTAVADAATTETSCARWEPTRSSMGPARTSPATGRTYDVVFRRSASSRSRGAMIEAAGVTTDLGRCWHVPPSS
ncbi:MAG: hypothetical protein R3C32_06385 [Chloroflexota bacterium]